jgi:transcriptional regulator GlxA family with amidase domain
MPVPFSVSLLLLPGFSSLSLGAVRSTFAAANEQAGVELYRLRNFAVDGVTALSQCGLSVSAEPLDALNPTDEGMILLFADELVDERQAARIGTHLTSLLARRDGSEPLVLGAVGAAAHVMAQQGLLDGYRAAIHWQILADAVQSFSRTVFSTNVFELDRDRLSCGGGATALDLLLHWLGHRHGSGFAAE